MSIVGEVWRDECGFLTRLCVGLGCSVPWMVMKVVSMVASIGVQVCAELAGSRPMSLYGSRLDANLVIHARTCGKESRKMRRGATRPEGLKYAGTSDTIGQVVSVTRRVVREHESRWTGLVRRRVSQDDVIDEARLACGGKRSAGV